MRAGLLRHYVTIESYTSGTYGEVGDETQTWSTLAQVWARIEPVSGREQIASAQTAGRATYQITIRYLSTVTGKMRVVHGSRTFYIDGPPLIDAKQTEMVFLATESA